VIEKKFISLDRKFTLCDVFSASEGKFIQERELDIYYTNKYETCLFFRWKRIWQYNL